MGMNSDYLVEEAFDAARASRFCLSVLASKISSLAQGGIFADEAEGVAIIRFSAPKPLETAEGGSSCFLGCAICSLGALIFMLGLGGVSECFRLRSASKRQSWFFLRCGFATGVRREGGGGGRAGCLLIALYISDYNDDQ
jgi:hypothetical protein